MKRTEEVCRVNSFIVSHCDSQVPGLYCLSPIVGRYDTDELAEWIWLIRLKLSSAFHCIVGVYTENDEEGKLYTVMLPFHIRVFDEMKIPYEEYQPYIGAYIAQCQPTLDEQVRSEILDAELRMIAAQGKPKLPDVPKSPTAPVSETAVVRRIFPAAEVDSLDESPTAPPNMKCFACIGGSRNFQCFFAEKELSRAQFMHRYRGSIPAFLHPFSCSSGIEFHQDAKFAIPGFMIIAPLDEYRTIERMPPQLYQQCLRTAFALRERLMAMPNVQNAFIYYDEHFFKPSSVHIWVLPIYRDDSRPHSTVSMLDHSIWSYMNSFEYCHEKERIRNTINELARFNYEL